MPPKNRIETRPKTIRKVDSSDDPVLLGGASTNQKPMATKANAPRVESKSLPLERGMVMGRLVIIFKDELVQRMKIK